MCGFIGNHHTIWPYNSTHRRSQFCLSKDDDKSLFCFVLFMIVFVYICYPGLPASLPGCNACSLSFSLSFTFNVFSACLCIILSNFHVYVSPPSLPVHSPQLPFLFLSCHLHFNPSVHACMQDCMQARKTQIANTSECESLPSVFECPCVPFEFLSFSRACSLVLAFTSACSLIDSI